MVEKAIFDRWINNTYTWPMVTNGSEKPRMLLLGDARQVHLQRWAKYFGEDGELRRTITFSEYQLMGGRLIPARMTVRPADKSGEYTQILYRDIEFDIQLPENIFSLASLRSRN